MTRRSAGAAPAGWNWNLHHHRAILDAIPPGARTAVDIGTGNGFLAVDLAERGLQVLALDVDAPTAALAAHTIEASGLRGRVEVRHADVLDPGLTDRFDMVASVSTLHHLPDEALGLRRMATLVAPAGVLVVVAFARPSGPADVVRSIAGTVIAQGQRLRGRYWEHDAPLAWPPPHTRRQLERLAATELPGSTVRPLMAGRYCITWRP